MINLMLKFWLWSGLAIIYIVLIWGWTIPINLYNADIGRHLTNGRLMTLFPELLSQNFYSYTWTHFTFNNHHWLYGLIGWWIYRIGGWEGLSLVNLALNLFTVSLVIAVVWRQLGGKVTLLATMVFLPLIINRYEIRPEVFSNLFIVVYGLIIGGYLSKKLSGGWLVLLLALQVLWINLHIYFFWGLVISGVFLAGLIWHWLWTKSDRDRLRWPIIHLASLMVGLSLVSLINPHGYIGLMMPFLIYGDHGYRILEEQSVWFLVNVLYLSSLNYYFLAAIILLSSIVIYWKTNLSSWWSWQIVYGLIGLAMIVLGGVMIRNFTVLGLTGLLLLAIYLKNSRIVQQFNQLSTEVYLGVVAVCIVVIVCLSSDYWTDKQGFKIGVDPQLFNSSQFFKTHNLSGPIFNNYDIGGYLIWNLFPDQYVFVDNRPEAYPASFFQDTYIPAQEDNSKWQALDNQYHFQTIYFNHQDLTPWAQQFIKNRLADDSWVVVYFDPVSIIMVKNNLQNKSIIEQFQINKSQLQPS